MNLTLANALRFSLPGGVFIALSVLLYPSLQLWAANALVNKGLFDAAVLFAAALLIGTLIQSAHRSLIYVYIVRFVLVVVREHRFSLRDPKRFTLEVLELLNPWSPAAAEISALKKAIRLRRADKDQYAWFRSWGDQTHFLWACFWACILARFLPSWFGMTPDSSYNDQAWWIIFVMGLFAVTDDIRHTGYEIHHHQDWMDGISSNGDK